RASRVEIDPEGGRALLGRVDALIGAVAELLATSDEGRMLREGVRLVIFGEPNAGKSSLLNLLVGHDRAMVSETPGTTRDTIEENLTLRGIPFRVVDTAGLRASDDPLEVEGMRRTRHHLEQADVAVRVLDASAWSDPGEVPPSEVRVLNKIDLLGGAPVPPGVVPMCCLDGRGLDELVEAIVAKTDLGSLGRIDEAVAINARHQHCLRTAGGFLDATRRSLESGDAPELTALELRSALAAIGEITGAVDAEEVLGRIFSTFCIGK
ncbi:MAG: 50S ribosome-binding GTPase, partial [Chthoniobacterales bacterium]|nr:50S ribosome-binding GTPase [Chthoniobacterales bacterium]